MGKSLGTGWGRSSLLLSDAETESIAPCQIQTDAEKHRDRMVQTKFAKLRI